MSTERPAGLARHLHYFRLVLTTPDMVKLGLSLVGSILVSLIETGSILLLLPLMSLLSGASDREGVLGKVSELVGHPPREVLLQLLVAVVLSGFILKDAFALAFRWWASGFFAELQVRTSSRMFSYLLRSPYSMHTQRTTADLLRVVGDAVGAYFGRTVGGVIGVITESISIITIAAALLFVMPLQTLAVALYFGVASTTFTRLIRKKLVDLGEAQLEAGKMTFEWMLWGLGGIKEIKLRHSYAHYIEGFRLWATKNAQAGRVAGFLADVSKYLLEILFIVGLGGLILGVGAAGGTTGVFATLALLGAASFRVLPSLTRLVASATTIRTGESVREFFYEELDREASDVVEPEHVDVDRMPFERSLELRDLTFTYPDASEPVLAGVNLTIPAGSSLAIVGGSGAGKTTLANLLLGLFEPTSGQILVDGVPMTTDVPAWQKNVAMVPQDVWLMDSTMAENIAFDQAPDDIDEALLDASVRQAQLGELVAGVFGGVHARFGERGSRLSGGQRQRIGIARALYRQPSFLLLDEATSALDNETERQITDTIAKLHGQITVVVIAHRLSTVKSLDSVVLLADGRVEDQGTFSELVARNDRFAHLVALGHLNVDPDE